MRELLQLSLKLLLFTVVAGLLLAITNAVTAGPIAQQKLLAESASRTALFPTAAEFTEVELAESKPEAGITAVYSALAADGSTIGYTVNSSVNGYKDTITLTTGVTASGHLSGVIIDSQAETQGVGSKITTESYLGQYTGLAASASEITANVDTITGATVSTSTVRNTVSAVADYTENQLGIEPSPAMPMDESLKYLLYAAPEADAFTGIETISMMGSYDMLRGVYAAWTDGRLQGYAFNMQVNDGDDDYTLSLGINSNTGLITGLSCEDDTLRSAVRSYIGGFAGVEADDAAIDALSAPGDDAVYADINTAVKQAIDFYSTYFSSDEQKEAA